MKALLGAALVAVEPEFKNAHDISHIDIAMNLTVTMPLPRSSSSPTPSHPHTLSPSRYLPDPTLHTWHKRPIQPPPARPPNHLFSASIPIHLHAPHHRSEE